MRFAARVYGAGKSGEPEELPGAPTRLSVLGPAGKEIMSIELQDDGSVTIRGICSPSGRWGEALIVRPHVSNVVNVSVEGR